MEVNEQFEGIFNAVSPTRSSYAGVLHRSINALWARADRVMDLLYANDQRGTYPPSWYFATANPTTTRPRLNGDIQCDIAIIGAGLTGISAALHLAEKGMDVIVVDAHRVGWGASGRNGGQLGMGQRVEQDELEKRLGVDAAHRLWDLSTASVELVKQLIKQYDINCQLTPGILHANHKRRFNSHSAHYVSHLKKHYHYHDLHYIDEREIGKYVDSPRYYGGTLDTNAAHLHPLIFTLALAQQCEALGGRIFEQSHIDHIDKSRIVSATGSITANAIIIATNGYGTQLHPQLKRRILPINNFIAVTEPLNAAVASSLIANQYAVADSKFVVNYFRMVDGNRLLFGGGENYGYRFPENIAEFVRKPMASIFPQLADVVIDYGWGGTLGITMQRMPMIRQLSPTLYCAGGYSGHGLGMATLCGKILAEQLAGDEEDFNTMARVPVPQFVGGSWLRHPLLVLAMLYYRLLDRI